MPSPQISQTVTESEWICEMHSRQTGRREMFIRGVPQILQSEGNNVANKLSLRLFISETRERAAWLCLLTALFPGVRFGSSLLLKTRLPRPVHDRAL